MRKSLVLLVLGIAIAAAVILYTKQYSDPSAPSSARVLRDFTPLRVGPDQAFFESQILYSGRQYSIVGRDSSGEWWQLDVEGTPGWVAASGVAETNGQNVPVIETTPCANDMSTTCPVTRSTTAVTMQTFEHGMMLLTDDKDWVYLLFDDGTFEGVSDAWNGQPLTAETPPEGLQQPLGSLGYLWLTRPGLRDRMGWASADAVTYTTTLEISDGTQYAPSDDVTYIRLPDGRAVGLMFYSGRWFYP